MNQKHKTPEDIFAPIKEAGLTASEQHDMWASLKSYAEFHPVKTPAPNPFFPKLMWQFASGITASLILFVGVGYAAQESLPGDTLYALKVEVIEPLAGTLETTEAEKLAYHISLLERRLEEVKLLKEENPDSVAISTEHVDEHVEGILAIVSEDADASLPEDLVLETLVKAKGITRAHDIVNEDQVPASTTQEPIDKLDVAFEVAVDSFAEEHPSDALTYLDSILEELDTSDTISSTTPMTETTKGELSNVATALEEGSIDEALSSASSIQEELLVTEYLSE
jgi:hypothetical protein